MEKKIYKCWCHVCGNEFDHESEFMSTGASIDRPDGNRAVITCNIEEPHKHTPEEIRDSYQNGYKALRS